MKRFNLLFILGIAMFFFYGCNTVKKGFVNQKKNSGDEFLVEKKSPLVEPPEYNKLPLPNVSENQIFSEDMDVKELIIKEEKNSKKTVSEKNINESFEETLLKKINKVDAN